MASASVTPYPSTPIFYKRFSVGDANTTCPAEPATPHDLVSSSTRPIAVQSPPTLEKRKRDTNEVDECDDARSRQRKVKKDERADLDVRRKQWLYAHRALFEPLLPSNHQKSFFVSLNKEMAGDATPALPMHNFVSQPELVVGGQMKDYQLVGLSFLAHMYHNGINAIVGDEMGLGKTLQTLSLFAHLKETTPSLTHLIVCPLSVLSSWETECARWVPSMRAERFHGSPGERERVKGIMRNTPVDIVLTTYETLSSTDMGWLKTRHFTCVVLDEGHRIKNADTDVASHAASVGGLWRLILTGTPIQNNLTELWGLLHWLYPQIFTQTTRGLFAASFDLQNGTYALPVINAVRALLATIQLRRTKAALTDSGALGGVPPREEWTVFIPFTEAQRFWTYRLLTRLDKVDLEAIFPRTKEEEGSTVDDGRREVLQLLENHAKGTNPTANQWRKFSMLLMQLRRICDHPYMIDDAQPEQYEIGEHIVASSSKLIMIGKILADVLPKGERVLIFSQWTDMLDLLEDFMVLRGIAYLRLDGSVSRARRAMVIRMFQRDDSEHKVFLISTKAGGLGINLTKASTCILCDSDWNPQNDLQAIARSHRIGQTKVVKVFRLICRASVEDQMLDRIRRKLFLSAKIIGGEDSAQNGATHEGGLGGSELMSVLRRGSSALTHSDDGMDLARFRSASLQEILDVSRAREDVHDARIKHELKIEVEGADEGALLRSAEEEEKELLSGVAKVQSYLFEGTVLQRSKPQEIPEVSVSQKRGRVDRTVTIGGMSFILDDSMLETVNGKEKAAPKKVKKTPFEWEDYCIACQDGGELVICNHCPRVFHAECHSTLSTAEVNRATLIVCSQHACCQCSRSSVAAGGLLLRCQTCPQAFCSDCVPWDDVRMVGDTIPEFVLRKYGKKDSNYFIRCKDCCELEKIDPDWLKSWETEIAEAQRLVDMM
ncbi:P-loop containing nucleoside triphosphate hydrolase protein [Mycena epipterygia]|nr:P-loop containing nucleoside triphosphate hydrolase protein [Mycena epipterygia]